MDDRVWFDRDVVADPSIGAMSSAVLYGKGIFTTLAVHNGKPFLWGKHWARLTAAAKRLSIDISLHPEANVLAGLRKLIDAKGLSFGRARITFLDGRSGSIWESRDGKTELLISAAENRTRPDQLDLTLSPCVVNSTSPLTGIKSCNYLEHLMAYDEARGRRFEEAIRLNEKGHVTSACMANVFWEVGGELFTPSLSTGCLPGTTREFVLEKLECDEVEAGIEALEAADRIFLTSAGLGVAPVAGFNGRVLDTSEHGILELLPQ